VSDMSLKFEEKCQLSVFICTHKTFHSGLIILMKFNIHALY